MKALEKPVANPSVASRQVSDGEVILVNLENSASLVLKNPTAILIWQLVDDQRTVQEIVAAVLQECPDAPPTAPDDIIETLDLLASQEFIHLT